MSSVSNSEEHGEMAIPVASKDNMSLSEENDQRQERNTIKADELREMSAVSPLPDAMEENRGCPVSGEGDDNKQKVKVLTSVGPCTVDKETEASTMAVDQILPGVIQNTGLHAGVEEVASSVSDIDMRTKGKGKPIIIRQDDKDDAVEDIRKRIGISSNPQKAVEPRQSSSRDLENRSDNTEETESHEFHYKARVSGSCLHCGKERQEKHVTHARKESWPYQHSSHKSQRFHYIIDNGNKKTKIVITIEELHNLEKLTLNISERERNASTGLSAQEVARTEGSEKEPPDIGQGTSGDEEKMETELESGVPDPPLNQIPSQPFAAHNPADQPLVTGLGLPHQIFQEQQNHVNGPQFVPEETTEETSYPAPGLPDLVTLGGTTEEGKMLETKQDFNKELAKKCIGKNKKI